MLKYNTKLKSNARSLRSNLTDAEQLLWFRLRRKQLCNIQFYRQRPLGFYIVDFYALLVKLVIETDGSQHLETKHLRRDILRDQYLSGLNLKILRFDNVQVLKSTHQMMEEIYRCIEERVPTSRGTPTHAL